jgi:hypothetical protein
LNLIGCSFSCCNKTAGRKQFCVAVLHIYNLISAIKLKFKSDKKAGVMVCLARDGGGGGGCKRLGGCEIACFHSKLSSVGKLGISLSVQYYFHKAFLLSASHYLLLDALFGCDVHSL